MIFKIARVDQIINEAGPFVSLALRIILQHGALFSNFTFQSILLSGFSIQILTMEQSETLSFAFPINSYITKWLF